MCISDSKMADKMAAKISRKNISPYLTTEVIYSLCVLYIYNIWYTSISNDKLLNAKQNAL